MSCGNPHEVDCVDVLHKLDVYLAQDFEEASCVEIRQHLEECAPCLQDYKPYEEITKLVGRCCGGEVTSTEFKLRLRAKLAEVQVQLTTVEFRSE
jgi:mycothiol system anti-sigma-R factor